MNLIVESEQDVLQEGVHVLVNYLGRSKAVRFLSAWRQGAGDYVKLREQLFDGETVDTLYDKILAHEQQETPQR